MAGLGDILGSVGGGGINKISKGRLPSLTKYTPSFAALVLKIKSKKKPYEVGGKNTYFAGFRPIIE